MRSTTETIIAALRVLANDIESPDGVANACVAEAADRLEELSKAQSEPVAWASPNVIPLRGLKDNHPAILTPFKCEANTVPLYTVSPDQSARIAELENSESFLKECVDLAIKDREYYESESKSRLEGLLGATEANRVSLGRIAELERQISALQVKRQPLSDDEILKIGANAADVTVDALEFELNLHTEYKKVWFSFARAIEKAHGIK